MNTTCAAYEQQVKLSKKMQKWMIRYQWLLPFIYFTHIMWLSTNCLVNCGAYEDFDDSPWYHFSLNNRGPVVPKVSSLKFGERIWNSVERFNHNQNNHINDDNRHNSRKNYLIEDLIIGKNKIDKAQSRSDNQYDNKQPVRHSLVANSPMSLSSSIVGPQTKQIQWSQPDPRKTYSIPLNLIELVNSRNKSKIAINHTRKKESINKRKEQKPTAAAATTTTTITTLKERLTPGRNFKFNSIQQRESFEQEPIFDIKSSNSQQSKQSLRSSSYNQENAKSYGIPIELPLIPLSSLEGLRKKSPSSNNEMVTLTVKYLPAILMSVPTNDQLINLPNGQVLSLNSVLNPMREKEQPLIAIGGAHKRRPATISGKTMNLLNLEELNEVSSSLNSINSHHHHQQQPALYKIYLKPKALPTATTIKYAPATHFELQQNELSPLNHQTSPASTDGTTSVAASVDTGLSATDYPSQSAGVGSTAATYHQYQYQQPTSGHIIIHQPIQASNLPPGLSGIGGGIGGSKPFSGYASKLISMLMKPSHSLLSSISSSSAPSYQPSLSSSSPSSSSLLANSIGPASFSLEPNYFSTPLKANNQPSATIYPIASQPQIYLLAPSGSLASSNIASAVVGQKQPVKAEDLLLNQASKVHSTSSWGSSELPDSGGGSTTPASRLLPSGAPTRPTVATLLAPHQPNGLICVHSLIQLHGQHQHHHQQQQQPIQQTVEKFYDYGLIPVNSSYLKSSSPQPFTSQFQPADQKQSSLGSTSASTSISSTSSMRPPTSQEDHSSFDYVIPAAYQNTLDQTDSLNSIKQQQPPAAATIIKGHNLASPAKLAQQKYNANTKTAYQSSGNEHQQKSSDYDSTFSSLPELQQQQQQQPQKLLNSLASESRSVVDHPDHSELPKSTRRQKGSTVAKIKPSGDSSNLGTQDENQFSGLSFKVAGDKVAHHLASGRGSNSSGGGINSNSSVNEIIPFTIKDKMEPLAQLNEAKRGSNKPTSSSNSRSQANNNQVHNLNNAPVQYDEPAENEEFGGIASGEMVTRSQAATKLPASHTNSHWPTTTTTTTTTNYNKQLEASNTDKRSKTSFLSSTMSTLNGGGGGGGLFSNKQHYISLGPRRASLPSLNKQRPQIDYSKEISSGNGDDNLGNAHNHDSTNINHYTLPLLMASSSPSSPSSLDVTDRDGSHQPEWRLPQAVVGANSRNSHRPPPTTEAPLTSTLSTPTTTELVNMAASSPVTTSSTIDGEPVTLSSGSLARLVELNKPATTTTSTTNSNNSSRSLGHKPDEYKPTSTSLNNSGHIHQPEMVLVSSSSMGSSNTNSKFISNDKLSSSLSGELAVSKKKVVSAPPPAAAETLRSTVELVVDSSHAPLSDDTTTPTTLSNNQMQTTNQGQPVTSTLPSGNNHRAFNNQRLTLTASSDMPTGLEEFGSVSESLQTNPLDLIDLQNSRASFELPSQLESLSMFYQPPSESETESEVSNNNNSNSYNNNNNNNNKININKQQHQNNILFTDRQHNNSQSESQS